MAAKKKTSAKSGSSSRSKASSRPSRAQGKGKPAADPRAALKAAQARIAATRATIQANAAAAKKRVKENERKLASIEKALGEEFTSLRQAMRALKAATVVPEKKVKAERRKLEERASTAMVEKIFRERAAARPAPPGRGLAAPVSLKLPEEPVKPLKLPVGKRAKSFKVEKLTGDQGKDIDAFLADTSTLAAMDKTLGPGEYWAAEVPHTTINAQGQKKTVYSRTWFTFKTLAELLRKLSEYKQKDLKGTNFMNKIRIIKFTGSGKQWRREKLAEQKQQRADVKAAKETRDERKRRKQK